MEHFPRTGYYTGHDLDGQGIGLELVAAGVLHAPPVAPERKVRNAKAWAADVKCRVIGAELETPPYTSQISMGDLHTS